MKATSANATDAARTEGLLEGHGGRADRAVAASDELEVGAADGGALERHALHHLLGQDDGRLRRGAGRHAQEVLTRLLDLEHLRQQVQLGWSEHV